jgi:predicted RNase H-like HicB family nuclease
MEYVYPALFHKNKDGSYTIIYPDLPGCVSEGKSLESALYMAQSALTQWIEYLSEKKQELPQASEISAVKAHRNEFINLVRADIKDGRAIKRTVSIPKWMDDKAIKTGLSLSRVLQDALSERLV